MSNPFSAALSADPLPRLRLEGRTLNVMGVASVAIALMTVLSLQLAPGPCVAGGIIGAVAFFVVGRALLARTSDNFAANTARSVGYAAYVIWAFCAYDALQRLGPSGSVPYLLAEAGVVLGLALAVRDRALEWIGVIASAAALALFGLHYQEWTIPLVAPVVAGCYAVNFVYGRRTTRGSFYLERASGVAGYATMFIGIYLLGTAPFNTVTMGAVSLGLIVYGFFTHRMWHRGSGVIGIFVACAKLWILDLSGASDGTRTMVGFLAFGVCAITAGIFYLVEYVWMTKPNKS